LIFAIRAIFAGSLPWCDRVGSVAGLARQLERHDARHVALHRQHLKVEHQPGVVRVRSGHANRAVEVRQRVLANIPLGPLDAPLYVAHGFEIMVHFGAIRRPEFPAQAGHVVFDEVQQAGPAAERGLPVGLAAPFAEQHLEHQPRVRLGRQRRRRRRPRQVVLVDAGEAVIALTDSLHHVHRQFQRRQLRLAAELLGGDLVRRRAQVVVRTLGVFGAGAAQERRIRRRVRAGVSVLDLHVRQH
jgi:hypothetical protein